MQNTMKRLVVLFLFLSVVVSSSHGQIQKPASWAYSFSKTKVAVGETVDLVFSATIHPAWYLYSSEFEAEGPIPTSFTLQVNDSFEKVGKLRAINPSKKFEPIWEGNVNYFTGTGEFRQTVRILKVNPVVKGSSEYQTCTLKDGSCIPGGEDFEFKGLTVAPAAESVKKDEDIVVLSQPEEVKGNIGGQELAPEPLVNSVIKAEEVTAQIDGTTEDAARVDKSLWAFALAAFLSGLVALLTPCVFPIIPMTVSFFTKQKGGKFKALFYGVSIVLIYTFIGTIVSRINGPAFANFLSTHWAPNLLFFGVFILFGLSFLGLFEIVLPSSLVNAVDAKADRGGYIGIFFMAFTLVLVSFSCTGPIVGSLLVASAGGEVLKPIVGMMAFSLAFAIPFTLFALFPQWLKSLPKSGGWLNTVKVVLGFLELALALKFLSIADQVYHWNLLDREVFLAFWIAIFILLGLYLLGKFRTPHDSPIEHVSVGRIILSIFVFSFVIYLIPGMWGAPLKALAGYLPPQTSQDFDLGRQKHSQVVALPGLEETPRHSGLFKLPHELQGFFDYKQALAYAKKVNKPVFIDFTGHGCVNCREMEARVWSAPTVLSRLQNDFVVVALYVDDKTELPPSEWYTSTYDNKEKKTIGAQNFDLQIVEFNSNAQPHYCLVDSDGKLLTAPVNYDLNVDKFVNFLDKGKAAFAKK
jgi:thiol:disulfide interchange protein